MKDFVIKITSDNEYEQAFALMDELIDDYDNQEPLIALLSRSIEVWEDSAEDFAEFNRHVAERDPGVAILRVLMDQYKLGVADFPEIGSKSLVSKILIERDRQLTRKHIDALSQRFGSAQSYSFSGNTLIAVKMSLPRESVGLTTERLSRSTISMLP